MSEKKCKSGRKLKLMARDHSDTECEKFSNLEGSTIKIEHSPDRSDEGTMPIPMFSVKVEVEKFDNDITVKNEIDSENELVIDETDYTSLNDTLDHVNDDFSCVNSEKLLVKSKYNIAKIDDQSEDKNIKNHYRKNKIECTENKSKTPCTDDDVSLTSSNQNPEVFLTVTEVFSEIAKILQKSSNKVERILAIEAKNTWGRVLDSKINTSELDLLLEKVFKKWSTKKQSVNGKSSHREVPLFYKCYICNKSWWYLDPFRHHLETHNTDTLSLSVEDNCCECNIIAYDYGILPDKRDINTEGDCVKCNRSYIFHKTKTCRNNVVYTCEDCNGKWYTCVELREHESGCRKFRSKNVGDVNKIYQCKICQFSFFTETELVKHMGLSHSVRSDVPVISEPSRCIYCCKKYLFWSMHSCPRRNMYYQCSHCRRPLSSQVMVGSHKRCTKNEFTCDICNITLEKHCMVPQHYLSHSEFFTLVYRCCICKDTILFLNDNSIKQHTKQCYKDHMPLEKTIIQYESIIIPKVCIKTEMDQINIIDQVQDNEPITKYELSLLLNNMKQQSPDSLEMIKLPTSDMTSEEVNVAQSPTTDIKIKNEIIEVEDEVAPRFFVMDTDDDDMESSIRITDYEEMLANMFQASNPASQTKTEIKAEPEEEYYDDDIIQLQMSLYNNRETDHEEISIDSSESSGPMVLAPDDNLNQGYKKPKLYTCGKCGYKNHHKEYMVHMTSNCRKNPKVIGTYQYKCTKCYKSFTTLKKYIEHFEDHGFKVLTCPKCREVLPSMVKLVPHLQYHVRSLFVNVSSIDEHHVEDKSKRGYQCTDCKATVIDEEFFQHWESHLVICKIKVEVMDDTLDDSVAVNCERTLDRGTLKNIIAHLQVGKVRNRLNRSCDVCMRVFYRNNDCKRHLIEHLLTDAWARKPLYGGLRCQICLEMHQTTDYYKRHMREHGSLPVYACELCDRSFSDSSNFTKHKKVHNQRANRCDICNKKFQAKASLEKHMEIHKVSTPTECPVCSKVCYTPSSLRKHIRLHDKTTRNFGCFICGNRFYTLKEKWDHMWNKHKERQYKADCPFCNKKFRRFIDLKQHVKSDHDLTVKNMRKVCASKQKEDIEQCSMNSSSLDLEVESP